MRRQNFGVAVAVATTGERLRLKRLRRCQQSVAIGVEEAELAEFLLGPFAGELSHRDLLVAVRIEFEKPARQPGGYIAGLILEVGQIRVQFVPRQLSIAVQIDLAYGNSEVIRLACLKAAVSVCIKTGEHACCQPIPAPPFAPPLREFSPLSGFALVAAILRAIPGSSGANAIASAPRTLKHLPGRPVQKSPAGVALSQLKHAQATIFVQVVQEWIAMGPAVSRRLLAIDVTVATAVVAAHYRRRQIPVCFDVWVLNDTESELGNERFILARAEGEHGILALRANILA